MRFFCYRLWLALYPLFNLLESILHQWLKPSSQSLVFGTLADLTRRRSELVLENALLRQQVIVLSRQGKRASLTHRDRWLFVLIARLLPSWNSALLIIQPDTLIRWHRELFKIFWRHKSKPKSNIQPATLPLATIELIWQLSADNRLWGAERIRGELLKLT